jgi:pSer/pThr/pTyr-binding forkhead associated (FHA) protein
VEDKVLGFLIDIKSKGKAKPVRFDMNKNQLTIGRDISNDIVIEDERISRAHARIEYSRQRRAI